MSKIEIDREFLISKYESGLNYREIAQELSVSELTVRCRAREYGIKSRCGGRKRTDVVGKKFGSITVMTPIEQKNKKCLYYLCKCDCGKETKKMASDLKEKTTCWDCRNKLIAEKNWKGHGEISGEFWNRTKNSAKIRNYDFDVTIEQMWELFISQERKCALSGVEIKFVRGRGKARKLTTASLDRIDSTKHYTLDNVQWVHKILNNLKMDLSEAEFISWCKLVANYKGK